MERSEELTYFEGETIKHCYVVKFNSDNKKLIIVCACNNSSLKFTSVYKRRHKKCYV